MTPIPSGNGMALIRSVDSYLYGHDAALPGDGVGTSVAMRGSTVVATAPGDDSGSADGGAYWRFSPVLPREIQPGNDSALPPLNHQLARQRDQRRRAMARKASRRASMSALEMDASLRRPNSSQVKLAVTVPRTMPSARSSRAISFLPSEPR